MLARISAAEDVAAVRQLHDEDVGTVFDGTDAGTRFAEVHLGFARWVNQRYEPLFAAAAMEPGVVLHDRVAAGESTFGTQALIDPLRRVTLLVRGIATGLQDGGDDRLVRIQLRLRWRR